ncbi:general substrate transporter [Aspergillus pseudonomiae]|uniref:Glucose transporter rco-3 n=2 Tax=Aspergillus subgen. Circumdati TaxID=2720871 RepID=A0A0L1IQ70_ASPN3|nr:glucose transporter rco-3 [Aspergillus nomiae NRRL 13137]XP_031936383.1 general substrate transporter [Aspergillus pseudonomiae]KAB8255355.1 general substrate transporter [Aspergillus pseudonomiae]KAE8399064.1 general substrate transporter [Aspergillus pseudonomiae]KNG81649.1 glucose transporter rco-3 [Aspergillus nomiae NRRL 13137]
MGFMLKKPDDATGSAAPAIMIGLFVAFGGVLFGYDTGTISGILAMPYWRKLFSTGYINPSDNYPDVTSSQSSMIVSLLSAGTFFGALGAAPIADYFGRRLAMIINTFVFCFGVILQTAATAIPLFVAGRFFAGLGVGLLSATIPLYQSETAPKWIRGTIVGAYQLAITIGLLLAAIVNNATKGRNDTGSYRIPVAVQFAWAIILVVGMILLPETPRFLIKKDKHEAAAKALSRLRRIDVNDPAIVEELAEIQANHEYELSVGNASYLSILRGSIGKRLATGCAVQALQQLAGVNFIFYYGTTFFEHSGIKDGFIITLITNIVNVVSTFPGLYMVEKWGRRPLLLFGAVGMCVSQLIVAIVGTATTSDVANKVLIAFVCVYIFFFACSWGCTAWVVTGELFPLKARAKCLSITTATNWLLNWAIAYATPYMVNSGPGNANLQSKVFFIWGGFCFIAGVFVYTCIYETKGLSLEQVDELYAKIPVAWRSTEFVPSVSYADVRDVAAGKLSGNLTELEVDAQMKRDLEHVEKA